MDYLRQTGRTTRMLERAITLARRGHKVCVLVLNRDHIRYVENQLRDLLAPVRLDLDLPRQRAPAAVRDLLGISVQVMPDEFNWQTMRPARSDWHYAQNSLWLVDHTVAEAEAARIADRILNLQRLLSHLQYLSN